MEFYQCRHCGNMIAFTKKSGVPVICCGEEMSQVTENTVDAAHEKHVPVITREGGKVHVAIGSVEHPMIEAQYIEWIAAEYSDSFVKYYLKPGEEPTCAFDYEKGMKVYAYCNLHGLWKKEIK